MDLFDTECKPGGLARQTKLSKNGTITHLSEAEHMLENCVQLNQRLPGARSAARRRSLIIFTFSEAARSSESGELAEPALNQLKQDE